jgi:hypothetical protein
VAIPANKQSSSINTGDINGADAARIKRVHCMF